MIDGHPHRQTKGKHWRRTDAYGNFTKSDSVRPEHIHPEMWKEMRPEEKNVEMLITNESDDDQVPRPGTSITPVALPRDDDLSTAQQGGKHKTLMAELNNEPPTDEEEHHETRIKSPRGIGPSMTRRRGKRNPLPRSSTTNRPQMKTNIPGLRE